MDSQRIWLATVLFSFFILTFNTSELTENVSWFIILIILFVIIQILHHLRANDWYFMKQSYKQLFLLMAGLFIAMIFIYQVGLFVLRMIVPVAGQGFAYIIGYPIVWILDLIRPDESNQEVRDTLQNLLEPPPEQDMRDNEISGVSSDWMMYTFLAIIIIITIAVLYYIRKHLQNNIDEEEAGFKVGKEERQGFSLFQPMQKLKDALYSSAGKNTVRIQFHKLQGYMQKREKGRLSSESAEEWFARIGLTDSVSNKILYIYQLSRYNNSEFTKEEHEEYTSAIKEIKQRFPKKPK